MFSDDPLNPNNYTWLRIGKRIVCRSQHTGEMLFNTHVPVTMRQALLFGYFIGREISDENNRQYIGWLESLLEQFKPETLPMSDGEYLELLSQIEGEPLFDVSLQDVLDDMDAQAKEKWELEKKAIQKEVNESWASVESEMKPKKKSKIR